MAYDPNVLRRASARLEEEERRREDERELLRRQTYAKEPRLAQLDRRLQGTMAELVAASLRKGENAGDAVRAIRDKNLELQQERAVLLGALGLPEDEDIDSNTVNGLVQEKTCHLPKVGDRFTLGGYDGVVTRTAKRRVTEVRLTPAEKPEPEKNDDEKSHYGRMTSK